MPRNCAVPGCNANTRRFLKENKALSTFAFPLNENLKKKWIRLIRRENSWRPTKFSSICELHFKVVKKICFYL